MAIKHLRPKCVVYLVKQTNAVCSNALKKRQTAAKEQAQVIELSVAGEELVSFELVRIPVQLTLRLERLFLEHQCSWAIFLKWTRSFWCSDYVKRTRSAISSRVGRKNKDGKIEAFDGVAVVVCHVFCGQRVPNLRSGKH